MRVDPEVLELVDAAAKERGLTRTGMLLAPFEQEVAVRVPKPRVRTPDKEVQISGVEEPEVQVRVPEQEPVTQPSAARRDHGGCRTKIIAGRTRCMEHEIWLV